MVTSISDLRSGIVKEACVTIGKVRAVVVVQRAGLPRRTQTHRHTDTHTDTHAQTRTDTHRHPHTDTHTQTPTQTHTRTHTHADTITLTHTTPVAPHPQLHCTA